MGFVVRTVYEREVAEATKIERSILHEDAELCSSAFGRACKGLWPAKTAEQLASRAQCSVRAAAYQISGEHDPSALSVLAVMTAITPKRVRK
jgi:hypothetical protein